MKKEVTTTKIRKKSLSELKLIKSLLVVKKQKEESHLDILERLIEVELNRLKKLKD